MTLRAVSLGVAVVLAACGGQETAAFSYSGVTAERPTGSEWISEDGLVAAYDMTTLTESGLLRDFGPNGLHGSFPGDEDGNILGDQGPGPVSGARIFRTTADRIDLPEDPAFDLDGPLTVAAWMLVDSLGLHQHVVACDDKWALWVLSTNRYRLGDTHGGGWSSDERAVSKGAWASVVTVLRGTKGEMLDPSTAALYVNGELADAAAHLRSDEARELGSWNSGDLFPSDACFIGFESHQGNTVHQTMPFVGEIDEILVFSRAWTEAEVQAFSRPTR